MKNLREKIENSNKKYDQIIANIENYENLPNDRDMNNSICEGIEPAEKKIDEILNVSSSS